MAEQVAVQSYAKVFPSSAVTLAEWISPTPLLLIGGSKSASAHFQQETYDAAKEPKDLYWVEGATHNDLYDQNKAVKPAVHKLASFFKPVLAAWFNFPARNVCSYTVVEYLSIPSACYWASSLAYRVLQPERVCNIASLRFSCTCQTCLKVMPHVFVLWILVCLFSWMQGGWQYD